VAFASADVSGVAAANVTGRAVTIRADLGLSSKDARIAGAA